jgi:hypothetical protein
VRLSPKLIRRLNVCACTPVDAIDKASAAASADIDELPQKAQAFLVIGIPQ